jgi:Ca-activated chloride channel family protein
MGGAYGGEGTLKNLAEETGGRVFRATNDRQLSDAFEEISNELRNQYSLGYTPSNDARDGSFRKIEVQARPGNLKVQARKGYYAVKPETR